jgi:acetyl-CoA C-acetyltransferase
MQYVYIVAGARTPVGGFQGSISDVSATNMGIAAIIENVA